MELGSIQKRIEQIEKISEELKVAKEMLKGELENDMEYLGVVEEAKVANEKKKRLKTEIIGKGPNQKIEAEIKENTEELKTLKEILSAELAQLFKENDTDEITDAKGETRKFQVQVKLLPAGRNYENRDDMGRYSEPA